MLREVTMSSLYVYRATLLIMSLTFSTALMSCAENPHLVIHALDQESAFVQFNLGPLIKEIDPGKPCRIIVAR